jgi:hypothetical protein
LRRGGFAEPCRLGEDCLPGARDGAAKEKRLGAKVGRLGTALQPIQAPLHHLQLEIDIVAKPLRNEVKTPRLIVIGVSLRGTSRNRRGRRRLVRLRTALESRLLEQADNFECFAHAIPIVMPGAPERTGFAISGIVDAAALRTARRPVNADSAVRGPGQAADELLLGNVAGCAHRARGRLRAGDGR